MVQRVSPGATSTTIADAREPRSGAERPEAVRAPPSAPSAAQAVSRSPAATTAAASRRRRYVEAGSRAGAGRVQATADGRLAAGADGRW